MSTNHIKWNDTDNRLTAYCDDDSGETEIGPARWDDTNNKLEINCDSTDFQAKWNDATNKLEAQGVASECCASLDNCCGEASIDVTFDNISDCGSIAQDCTSENGNTFTVPFSSGGTTCTWYYNASNVEITISWVKTTGVITVAMKAETDLPTYRYCFYGTSGSGNDCGDLPLTINGGDIIYCNVLNEGYGGTAYLEWT